MTALPENIQNQQPPAETKQNDKEFNFAQIRKQLEAERNEKIQLQERIERLEKERKTPSAEVEESYDEPYVDEKYLNKKLSRFEEKFKKEVHDLAEQKAQALIEKERQDTFLKSNPDFAQILTPELLQKFAEKHPEIAEPMLELPATFARQKVLYQNIKALGLHKKEEPPSPIQETIDKNRKNPYYMPSSVSPPPYAGAGDFSPAGQKAAYQRMQEMKSRLRM